MKYQVIERARGIDSILETHDDIEDARKHLYALQDERARKRQPKCYFIQYGEGSNHA